MYSRSWAAATGDHEMQREVIREPSSTLRFQNASSQILVTGIIRWTCISSRLLWCPAFPGRCFRDAWHHNKRWIRWGDWWEGSEWWLIGLSEGASDGVRSEEGCISGKNDDASSCIWLEFNDRHVRIFPFFLLILLFLSFIFFRTKEEGSFSSCSTSSFSSPPLAYAFDSAGSRDPNNLETFMIFSATATLAHPKYFGCPSIFFDKSTTVHSLLFRLLIVYFISSSFILLSRETNERRKRGVGIEW